MYACVNDSDDIVHSYFLLKQILLGGGLSDRSNNSYDFPAYPKLQVIL